MTEIASLLMIILLVRVCHGTHDRAHAQISDQQNFRLMDIAVTTNYNSGTVSPRMTLRTSLRLRLTSKRASKIQLCRSRVSLRFASCSTSGSSPSTARRARPRRSAPASIISAASLRNFQGSPSANHTHRRWHRRHCRCRSSWTLFLLRFRLRRSL